MIFETENKKPEQDTIRLDWLEPGHFYIQDPSHTHYICLKLSDKHGVHFWKGEFKEPGLFEFNQPQHTHVIDLGPAIRIETMYDVDSKLERLAAKKYREEQERQRAKEESQ